MYHFKTLIYYLSGVIALIFCSTNTQSNFITFKRKCLIAMYISFLTFLSVAYIGQMATPFVIMGICILLTFRLEHKLSNLICFFLGYLLQVFLDYAYTTIIYILFHLTIKELQQHYFYLFPICYLPVLFFSTKLLGWFLHKKLKINDFLSSGKFSISICINLSVIVIIFIFGIVYGEKIGYPPKVVFFNGFLFTIYFVLSNITFFVAYRTVKKDEQLKAQLEIYKNLNSYTQEVERLYHSMRAFKHDYIDILTSMKNYIDKNDSQALSSYFYDTILPANQEIIDSDSRLGLLSYLEDDAVKSVVSAKLMVAMEKGIHVELEIRDTINFTGIDRIDLIRILGIFLNNAIDSASDSIEKEMTVAFIKEKQKNVILIRNSTLPLLQPLTLLCNQDISSKEGHSGIGLYTAKNILDAYENIRWKLDYKEPYFLTELVIYTKQ